MWAGTPSTRRVKSRGVMHPLVYQCLEIHMPLPFPVIQKWYPPYSQLTDCCVCSWFKVSSLNNSPQISWNRINLLPCWWAVCETSVISIWKTIPYGTDSCYQVCQVSVTWECVPFNLGNLLLWLNEKLFPWCSKFNIQKCFAVGKLPCY